MKDYRKQIKEIASKGRFGDDALLHVSKHELAGLASLVPGGKLPKNPDTGLPEAFLFLLPLLAGAAAPAAAAATTAATALPAAAAAAAAEAAAATAAATTAATTAAGAAPALASAAAGAAPALAGAAEAAGGLASLAPAAAVPATTTAATAAPALATAAPLAGEAAGGLAAATPALTAAGEAGIPAIAGTAGAAEAGGGLASGLGGLMGGMDMSQMMQMMAPLAMMGGGGGSDEKDEKDYKANKDRISKIGYNGGPTSMPSPADLQGYGVAKPEFNFFRNPNFLYAEGGPVNTGANDEALVAATVDAILGRSPNPDAVIMAFVKTFGEDALRDLAARVRQMQSPGGRHVKGPGTATSDSVPAVIDGKQPAALSNGEFVVPTDVVNSLGGGDNNAGAQSLYNMMNGVRKMASGGLVRRYASGGSVTPFQQGLMSVFGG